MEAKLVLPVEYHSLRRVLQVSDSPHGDIDSNYHEPSSTPEDSSFLIFSTVIVALIVLCYVVSMIQCVRLQVCPNRILTPHIMSDEERMGGRIVNLTARQRRAVMEAFFSIKDYAPENFNKKKHRKSYDDKGDCKKPSACDQKVITSSDQKVIVVFLDDDLEAREKSAFPNLNDDPKEASEKLSVRNLDDGKKRCPRLVMRERIDNENNKENLRDVESAGAAAAAAATLSQCEETESEVAPASISVAAANPENVEAKPENVEAKPENVEAKPENVAKPSLWRRFWNKQSGMDYDEEEQKQSEASSSSGGVETDDRSSDDDEPLCAICLNGYEDGDLVIDSKHCTHQFHRQCILEWLEKNDDCPICREDMITSGEMNATAITIVGKQRMIRAVASFTTPHSLSL